MSISINRSGIYKNNNYNFMKSTIYLEEDSELENLFQSTQVKKSQSGFLKRHHFNFPNNLIMFDFFKSTREIEEELQKEEASSTSEKRGLFSKKYIPNFQQAVRVYYRCKECKACLNFKRENNGYRFLKVQVSHDHQPRDSRKDQKEYFLKYFHNYKGSTESRDFKKQMIQTLNINERQFYYLKSLAVGVPTNTFKFVEKFLRARKMKAMIEPGHTDFPSRMLMTSDIMIGNCERYGDAIKLVSYQNTIFSSSGNRYVSVILYGQDTNMRLVMLAAALLEQYSAYTVFNMFIDFLSFTGCKPECIATTEDPIILEAMKLLQTNNFYTGLHVFDLDTIKTRIKSRLKPLIKSTIIKCQIKTEDAPKEVINLKEYYKQFKALFKERDSERGKSTILKLSEDINKLEDLESKEVLSDLLLYFFDTMKKTCMWSIPAGYIGYIQDVKSDIKLPEEMTVIQFCKEIYRINKMITARYQQRFREHIEEDYRDSRMKVLRESLETNILLVFLKNFRDARENMDIIASSYDQASKIHNFEIENRNNRQQKELVENWICSCGLKERTGMPCSHLLAAALEVPEITYETLFKERWIKGLQTRVHTRRMRTCRMRQGRARKTRRNHFF